MKHGTGAEQRGVMAGDGYYDRHSTTQRGAAAVGEQLLSAAAADVQIAGTAHPRIADLGCAEGHNSLAPMKVAIDGIRARSEADIDVVHTDLPDNDWATLFHVIEHDPSSYIVGHAGDVHPSVVGRSFYERMFAPATLSIAWASSALHWLSESPGSISDQFFVQASADQHAVDRCRSRARADLAAFLDCRSIELVPTGSIVFVDVLMGDDGTMGSEALFDTLEQSLRAARDSARITAEEYAAITYPTWFRSLDEIRAPFTPTFLGTTAATLELVALQPASLPDPFWPDFESSGDAAAYGRSQSDFLRGFLEPSFRVALGARSGEAATGILDAIFRETAVRIAADPHAVSPTYRLVAGRVRRAS